MQKPDPSTKQLNWQRTRDSRGNDVCTALSHTYFHADGTPKLSFTLTQQIWGNEILWTNESSTQAYDGSKVFLSLDLAKQASQQTEDDIRADLGLSLPAAVAPAEILPVQDDPLICDKHGFAPTHQVISRWSRRAGRLYLYRVWRKPADPEQSQEREITGPEYDACLEQFARQKLTEMLAKKLLAPEWVECLSFGSEKWGFALAVSVHFAAAGKFVMMHEGEQKELPPITENEIQNAVHRLEAEARKEMDAKVAGRSEEELRAELEANAALAGVNICEHIIPVTLENMAAEGIPLTGRTLR